MFRGCFSECVDSLIPEEDRGELKRIYGEGCLDQQPTCVVDSRERTKTRSMLCQQFMIRVSQNSKYSLDVL